jgi:hypothetical protein
MAGWSCSMTLGATRFALWSNAARSAGAGRALAENLGTRKRCAAPRRPGEFRHIQEWLGHRSIQHTTRSTQLSAAPFKNFWR